MQPEAPEDTLSIAVTATLKAAVMDAAAADGQSVNAWVTSLLEDAVKRAQENTAVQRDAEEERRKQVAARQDKAWEDMMDKHSGHNR